MWGLTLSLGSVRFEASGSSVPVTTLFLSSEQAPEQPHSVLGSQLAHLQHPRLSLTSVCPAPGVGVDRTVYLWVSDMRIYPV